MTGAGGTLHELAAHLGEPYDRVRRRVHRAGLHPDPDGRYPLAAVRRLDPTARRIRTARQRLVDIGGV